VERRPPGRHHHEWVGGHHIGPLRRQRGQLTGRIEEVDPIDPPVLPSLDELELPAGQRMERMGHPHPRRITQIPGIGCTRRLDPTDASSLNSLIQAAKRRARGWRSKNKMITIIYLTAGKLPLPQIHTI